MIDNLLPEISEADRELLTSFAKNNSNEAQALKRILKGYMEYFRDIRSINLNENVGLQTCSHARAYDMLEQIFNEISFHETSLEKKKLRSYK